MKSFRLIGVDDDPLALDQLRKTLRRTTAPVECAFYGSPAAALRAHKERPADLVLADLRLGTTTGIELIAQMRQAAPDAVYMLLSGEADLESALAALNHGGIFRFFLKPADCARLEEGLNAAVAELNLKSLQAISGAVLSSVDQLPCAVANLDRSGRILFANERAEVLLFQRGYFNIGADRTLRSVNAAETKAFLRFLAEAPVAGSDCAGAAFRFTHPEQTSPLVLSILSAPDAAADHFTALISDPARKNFVTVSGIALALGLAKCEARVVHGLIEGGNIEDAARLARVSVSTARSYIKNVFTKTGVSRQAELVRLALMSAA